MRGVPTWRARRTARHAVDGLAHRRSFERHLRRVSPTADWLRARGHDNPNVLALLAVESFYRPRPLRLLEYVNWAVASWLGRPQEKLSVGRAQMQLVHWRSLGMIPDTRFSFDSLARVRDPEANYLACCRFLEREGMLAETEEVALSNFYSGGPSYADQLGRARRAAIRAASPSPSAPA